MLRLLFFVVAFVVGVALTAPLERWVLPLLRQPLRSAGIDLRVDSLRFALPAGLEADGIALEGGRGDLRLDSFYVGLTRSFHVEGCGGSAAGSLTGDSVSLELESFDLSRCARIGRLTFEGAFDGSLSLEGTPLLPPRPGPSTRGSIDLACPKGIFGGIVPGAGEGGADLPLGDWEFSDLVLRASLADGELDVREGRAVTSGVEWRLVGASFRQGATKTDLRIDFQARALEDTPKARALLGLLPRAGENAGGWRSYRIVGPVGGARILGLE